MTHKMDNFIRNFIEDYVNFNGDYKNFLDKPISEIPRKYPYTISYSVLKMYWDSFCLENGVTDWVSKEDLVNFIKEEYKKTNIKFIDGEERILFACIKQDKIISYLH